ncbi:MAG: DNA helicase RecQ [Rhodothalassiaceae bacterium]
MTDDALSAARLVARRIFGFSNIRPSQEPVLADILAGRDVLAILPTGAGKSLCYQLPALIREDLTLVVSPLIALMRDQVRALEAVGIAAASLNSLNDEQETREALARLEKGTLRLLYVSPERLALTGMQAMLARAGVARIAVDEAHCVSQWGHDFRPDYLELGTARRALGVPQMLAFTATADMATREDIANKLFDRPPCLHVHGFDRPNLSLAMSPRRSRTSDVAAFLARHRGASGIVYCMSRNATESLRDSLIKAGHRAIAYHAGLDPQARREAQDRFQREDGIVMTATVAFGMGIDKPDIRFVVHAGLPKSIEAWYQEIGRAGRDGLPAETLLLHGGDDIRLRRRQIAENDASSLQKKIEYDRLNSLLMLVESPICRRVVLLRYFGEEPSGPCGNCDVCTSGIPAEDARVLVQKALSAVLRTGQIFGTSHLVALLRGETNAAILRHGHDSLPTFGVGQDRSRAQWTALFRQMHALGLIEAGEGHKSGWRITDDGRLALKGAQPILLRPDPRGGVARAVRRPDGSMPEAALDAKGRERLDALKTLRRELAEKAGVPAYVIFADRTLIELATKQPASIEDMRDVYGIGDRKLERYGAAFLSCLARQA